MDDEQPASESHNKVERVADADGIADRMTAAAFFKGDASGFMSQDQAWFQRIVGLAQLGI